MCFPRSIFSLIAPVSIRSSPRSSLIIVDFPTPLGPATVAVFPARHSFNSSNPLFSLAETMRTLLPLCSYAPITFSVSSSETRSSLLKQMTQGRFLHSIWIKKRSSRLKFGSGLVSAKITSPRSTFATSGRSSLFFLGRIRTILPFFSFSSSIVMAHSSPTNGFSERARNTPLALHS